MVWKKAQEEMLTVLGVALLVGGVVTLLAGAACSSDESCYSTETNVTEKVTVTEKQVGGVQQTVMPNGEIRFSIRNENVPAPEVIEEENWDDWDGDVW